MTGRSTTVFRSPDQRQRNSERRTNSTVPGHLYAHLGLQKSLRGRAVGSQHLASEIERAGDQDARRRIQIELAGDIKGAFEIVAGECRKGDGARNLGELSGRYRLVLMDRHGNNAAREPGKV